MYHGLGNRFLKVGVVSEVALNIFLLLVPVFGVMKKWAV
jgi:hypothetical protein